MWWFQEQYDEFDFLNVVRLSGDCDNLRHTLLLGGENIPTLFPWESMHEDRNESIAGSSRNHMSGYG